MGGASQGMGSQATPPQKSYSQSYDDSYDQFYNQAIGRAIGQAISQSFGQSFGQAPQKQSFLPPRQSFGQGQAPQQQPSPSSQQVPQPVPMEEVWQIAKDVSVAVRKHRPAVEMKQGKTGPDGLSRNP